MLRTNLVTSRGLRVYFFGFVAVTAAVAFTTDIAEARHYRHYHHAVRNHHAEASEDSYGPPFSEMIVDANSGATLSSTNPDASRHPASLTKIMTLYLLFERLDAGKIKLDTELPVSRRASEQDPTKLGLLPGQTIRVEDAIKGLVTRSANDAAVVIAEALGGSEEDFCKLMTRKAHALGMTHTTYVNASGLPDDAQVTTARDQATLGRAIQDRFPRYYRYFSTVSFTFRGHSIANHNHLLGSVEGVDGIKTGYTRSSGFNLVTSIRRGNRHLVGVVMGGHSAGSRDAIMRNLLAENLDKGATHRTVAAITEHNPSGPNVQVANSDDEDAASASDAPTAALAPAPSQPASVSITPAAPRPAAAASLMSRATADASSLKSGSRAEQARTEPAPLTSGVIQTQPIAAIPGSSEPMKPVRVKTVQIKAGQVRLASAGPAQPAPPITSTIPARSDVAETSKAVVAKAELPPQPLGHGTGNGILGVLPASSVASPSPSQTLAHAEPAQQPSAKPETVHTGWIVQVGALESESEAQKRIEAARDHAHGLLNKADPFTETVVAKGDRTLVRARFAGLDRDQAEAVCRTLKRSDISCMTVHN
ncbi:D-alanyl-D-alanine carboxypeptidase [Bradyrhizobium sp.]|uniref:D-alanyl-D-alanine carboxypeptidase n=1 Tax=Bradyrhizobium sp. TaxID=376 RepID=UPI0026147FE8|nr:D-alanyl-D-alanine carboxypeptidase [Bradyrhizobium sp.]